MLRILLLLVSVLVMAPAQAQADYHDAVPILRIGMLETIRPWLIRCVSKPLSKHFPKPCIYRLKSFAFRIWPHSWTLMPVQELNMPYIPRFLTPPRKQSAPVFVRSGGPIGSDGISGFRSVLVTQKTSVDKSFLDDMIDVTEAVMTPFAVTNLKVTVTGITIDKNGKPTVTWSWDETDDQPYTPGSAITVPDQLKIPATFLVRTEVDVDHELMLVLPGLKGVSAKTLTMSKTYHLRQRIGDMVACENCGPSDNPSKKKKDDDDDDDDD